MDQPPVAAHRGDLHLPVRIAPPEPDQRHRFATVAAFTKALRRIGMAHRQPHVLAKHMRAQQRARGRSEEHTSELQSLMRISYAVFCLKKKKTYLKLYRNI